MKIRLAIGLTVASLLLAGCAKQTAGQLQERLDSAKAIDNGAERDVAMQNLAKDAADNNVPDLALEAVNSIESGVDKDNTAAYCARKIDKHGNRVAAEVFVRIVQNGALRDQLHFEFAAEAPPVPTTTTSPSTQP